MSNFHINGITIPFEQRINYLGMIFDSKLTWKPHIIELKAKCMKTLNIMRTLSGMKWGANRQSLLKVYTAMIQSRLMYGSVAYTTANKSNLSILQPVQYLGVRIATGAYRTSPAMSIICEAGQLPLKYLYNRFLFTWLIKVEALEYHPLCK